ncbi:MAG: glycosyltransferase family 4 protein [Parvularculales bacterium]
MAKAKPCVMQIIPRLEGGGAERTTVDVATALVSEGWLPLVVSAGGHQVAAIEAIGAEHICLPVHSKNPVTIVHNIRRLRHLIDKHQVDLLHVRSRAPAWSVLRAARRCNIPLVATWHGAVPDGPALKIFYSSALVRGDVVIANSCYTAERIKIRYPRRIARLITIHRGTDLAAYDPKKEDSTRTTRFRQQWNVGTESMLALMPARQSRTKGHDCVIEALAQLDPDYRPVVVFAGGYDWQNAYGIRLKNKACDLGVKDAVRFVPHIDDMPGACWAADIILSPSLQAEAFGRVAVEGQAAGRPVIVADHGGARETVINDNEATATGWRITPGDATTLARALQEAAAMGPKGRTIMGQRGRNFVAPRFSLDAMCSATLDVYRSLLHSPRHSSHAT